MITRSWISKQPLVPGTLYKTHTGVKKLLGIAVDQHNSARLAFSDIVEYNKDDVEEVMDEELGELFEKNYLTLFGSRNSLRFMLGKGPSTP